MRTNEIVRAIVDDLLVNNERLNVNVEQKQDGTEVSIRKNFVKTELNFTDDTVKIIRTMAETLPLAQPDSLDKLAAILAESGVQLCPPKVKSEPAQPVPASRGLFWGRK